VTTVDYKEALYRRELRIDCTNITLTQNTDQDPLRFIGNGYIHQQPDGTLNLYMYASPNDEVAPAALFRISAMANFLARDKYFSLCAVAYSGDEWTCDSVRAECDVYGRELIIRGRLYEIRRAESGPEGTSPFFLEIQIYQELGFQHMSFVKTMHDFESAYQRRLSTFQTRFGSCEARSLEDRFFWHLSSQSPMPDNLHDLAVAALEFLAARTAVPRVVEYHRGADKTLRLLSPRPLSERTRLRRPLSSQHLVDLEMPWRLFNRYLEYLASYSGSGWHPCVLHLHNAIEASANSLDAARLGLCVAVEGLAKLVPILESEEEKKAIKKLSKTMRCVLKRFKLSGTTLGQRAEGLLSTLNIPRLKDRLESLVQAGVIRPTLIKAWDDLRHGAAHAAGFDIDYAKPEATQKLLIGIDKVTTLMYEIIFHLIGYEEEYTDYSEPDWPPRRLKTGTAFEADDPRARQYRPRP
jgi:hypothetical protein